MYSSAAGSKTIDALKLYTEKDQAISVITPPFIANAFAVKATFMTYCSFSTGNWVSIEYRENGGEWIEAVKYTEIPEPDEEGFFRHLSTTFRCTKGAMIEMRYTASIPAYYTLGIGTVEVEPSTTCFPPTNLTIDAANVTDRQLALRWTDETNETASYVIAYQETATNEADVWMRTAATEKTGILTGLKPNTAYHMQVQALCDAKDSSAFSRPLKASTYSGLPYTESFGDVHNDPTNPSDYTMPSERGVTTYNGLIGETLRPEDNTSYIWATRYSSSALQGTPATAMGVHEGIDPKNAVMITPVVYSDRAATLTFTLNSFNASQKGEDYRPIIVNGAAPTEAEAKLHVAVSNNGAFTMGDVILTLTGAQMNVIDSTFEFGIEKTGAIQIAFFFSTPEGHWDDAFYLEAYNLSLTAVPEEYTLSLTASPAEGGTLTGAGKHKEGNDVTITATPNEGFDFVAWMNGTVQLATTASYTFKMPNADAAYTAVFKSNKPDEPEEEYELTLTASPANGGRVSGAGLYLADEEVTISAEANQGFKFVAWLNDTDTLSKEATHTFKMPDGDLSLTAKFIVETANEDAVKTSFGVSTRDGRVHVRNLGGMTVNTVDIYTLTGNRLHRFSPNSREDLILPVDAERALLFIRINAENGTAVYKVYLH